MKNLVCLILILVSFAGIVGCDEPVKKPVDTPINRITLIDMMPKHSEKLPTAINFKIFTFQIPVANYGDFSGVFYALSTDMMRFSNEKSFKSNGFAAGLGETYSWQIVDKYLRKSGARRSKMTSLIAYEYPGEDPYPGNDFLIGNVTSNTLISYFDLERNSMEMPITTGFLGWRIKARQIAHRRGLIQVKIQGMFKPMISSMLSRAKDFDIGERIFKPTSMVMNMNEGDFVLIGASPNVIFSEPTDDDDSFDTSPDTYEIEPTRLVDLFFRTRADLNMPNETESKDEKIKSDEDESKEGENEEVFYHLVKGVEIVEVFLIVNLGVKN